MPNTRNIDHLGFVLKRDVPSMWDDFIFSPALADQFVYKHDHFLTYNATDWTVTETDSNATELVIDEHGGILRLAQVGDAENDVIGLQLGTSTGESVAALAGRNIYFETRIRTSSATQHDICVGLCDTDTGVGLARPSDGIYFFKDDGDLLLDLNTSLGSVNSQETGVHSIATSTFVKLGFKVIGLERVDYYVNDVLKASISSGLPTGELRLTFASGTGDTNACALDIDYYTLGFTR